MNNLLRFSSAVALLIASLLAAKAGIADTGRGLPNAGSDLVFDREAATFGQEDHGKGAGEIVFSSYHASQRDHLGYSPPFPSKVSGEAGSYRECIFDGEVPEHLAACAVEEMGICDTPEDHLLCLRNFLDTARAVNSELVSDCAQKACLPLGEIGILQKEVSDTRSDCGGFEDALTKVICLIIVENALSMALRFEEDEIILQGRGASTP